MNEGGVIECKEFVPTTLGLMDSCNEDAFKGVLSRLVVLFRCRAGLVALPGCLASLSCSDIFLLLSRCLLLCLPLALLSKYCPFRVCCPLLVVVLLVRFICCLQLSNRIASTPRALLLVSLSCLVVDGILHMWSQVSNQGAHSTRGLMSMSFVDILQSLDIFPRCLATLFLVGFDIMHHASCMCPTCSTSYSLLD